MKYIKTFQNILFPINAIQNICKGIHIYKKKKC